MKKLTLTLIAISLFEYICNKQVKKEQLKHEYKQFNLQLRELEQNSKIWKHIELNTKEQMIILIRPLP